MKRQLFIIGLIQIALTYIAQAQVETKYISDAKSSQLVEKLKDISQSVKTIKMPSFDVKTLLTEDDSFVRTDAPYRIGKCIDVSLSFEDGVWKKYDEGIVWVLSIESKNAKSLNFIFDGFSLPSGAFLEIMNNDGTVLYGPVKATQIPKSGYFLTDVIPGDGATIFLYEPNNVRGQSKLTIKRVIHGYRDLVGQLGFGASSPCNIDIDCYPEYKEESKGVGLLLYTSGGYLNAGSGSLLMTTDKSFKPYFLTAFHNIDMDNSLVIEPAEKDSVEKGVFRFCYKLFGCGGMIPVTSYLYEGAILKAAWQGSDFALLEITDDLKSNPYLNWLGWNRGTEVPSKGVCVHHPLADVMKISIDNDCLTTIDWGGSGVYNHWCTNFDVGIYQAGSSGSPLFDQNNRVVGQLHGGPNPTDPCDRTTGYFGKFSSSWTGGGTSYTRLCNWLDSLGLNNLTTNTDTPLNIIGPVIPCGSSVYYVDNLPNDGTYTVVWYWKETSTFICNLNQCTINNSGGSPITGTLVAAISGEHGLIREVEKKIDTGANFVGTAQQAAWSFLNLYIPGSAPTVIHSGDYLFFMEGSMITLKSQHFVGATISYTGYMPDYWSHNDSIVSLRYNYIQIPPFWDKNNEMRSYANRLIITGSYANSCETFRIVLRLLPPMSNDLESTESSLTIFPTGQGYTFTLGMPSSSIDNATLEKDSYPEFSSWHLTIAHSLTGKVVYDGDVEGTSKSVNSVGWDVGVYVVRAQLGDHVVTRKIFVSQ